MQNFLGAFLFAIINFAAQCFMHFVPYLKDTTPNIRNIVHIMRLALFNTSIGAVLYDVFKDVGTVKYFLYVLALCVIVVTSQEIVRANYMIVLVVWFAVMIGVAYLLCFFRDDLNINACLVCDYKQANDKGENSDKLYVRGFYD